MLIGELGGAELRRRLRGEGLGLRLFPFTVRLYSRFRALASAMVQMYADFPLADGAFADFSITIRARRWWKPQAVFELDGQRPFWPLPADQAYPMFEWGLNWCIANHVQDYLILHAAVLERDGGALILPGPSGAGKSTLTAGLALSGWRLLSDELTLLRLEDGKVQGLARPVSLKNESIEVVRRFAPQAVLSPASHNTAKGTVRLMVPPTPAVARLVELATPRWLVVPQFEPGEKTRLQRLGRTYAFMNAAQSAFNYAELGITGFELLADTVARCEPYSLTIGSLDQALIVLDELTATSATEANAS